MHKGQEVFWMRKLVEVLQMRDGEINSARQVRFPGNMNEALSSFTWNKHSGNHYEADEESIGTKALNAPFTWDSDRRQRHSMTHAY